MGGVASNLKCSTKTIIHMKQPLLILVLLANTVNILTAQQVQQLQGKVLNDNTKDPLPGVRIIIIKTSRSLLYNTPFQGSEIDVFSNDR